MADRPSRTPGDDGAAEVVMEARGLVKTFTAGRSGLGRTRVSAVDGVDLTLRAGESLGIVGESGCGKSTLARMLTGLEIPDAGTITYRGKRVGTGRRADRRLMRMAVQMVFQDPYTSLDPRMTVLEVVGEPLAAAGRLDRTARKQRVVELLSLVGLSADLADRYPHQFSGGQRQRIGIARALALEPDVLVCDEPVSALDVSVQAQVVNLLHDIQRRLGLTLVFISHDLSVVRHVTDRVAVMYLGRLAESGATRTVYSAPAHPYTQALLSASPVVDRAHRGRLASRVVLAGDLPSPTHPPAGCRFHTRCPVARANCSTDVPILRRPETQSPDDDRVAACHYAEEVLAGTVEPTTSGQRRAATAAAISARTRAPG